MKLITDSFYLTDLSLENKVLTLNVFFSYFKTNACQNANILVHYTHLYIYALTHTSGYMLIFLAVPLN